AARVARLLAGLDDTIAAFAAEPEHAARHLGDLTRQTARLDLAALVVVRRPRCPQHEHVELARNEHLGRDLERRAGGPEAGDALSATRRHARDAEAVRSGG